MIFLLTKLERSLNKASGSIGHICKPKSSTSAATFQSCVCEWIVCLLN